MATVAPGKVFAENERITRAKLNQLGAPIVELSDEETEDLIDEVRQAMPYQARNVLINGNFDVWQRGGYVNLVGLPVNLGTTAAAEYGPDRWLIGTPSGTNKRQVSRQEFTMGQTSVPNEPSYFMRWNELVAETGDYRPILTQNIEDVRTLAGKNAVVTWWMKGNYSGNITCRIIQHSGWTVGPAAYPTRTTAASSGGTAVLVSGANWTKYTATFAIPSLASFGIEGAGHHLGLQFLLPDNITFQIDFAQVQMEEGTAATTFETLPYLETFQKCQRYFEYHGGLAMDDITHGGASYYFATRKFRAPDLTLIAGYAGTMTAANFSTILDVGYYQDTANSVVSTFFMKCDAEIY